MKKAFTLIELLVVIAIIAILAAILFPVFAQAKLAAKKTVSISNIKQMGLGIYMYAADYDDAYPHNDDCTLNDSLFSKWNNQPAGTDPSPWCTGGAGYTQPGGFAFRDNHYGWQKWVRPYVKNVDMFIHPVFTTIYGTSLTSGSTTTANNDGSGSFVDQGELANGYALNIAITGAQNTWNYPTVAGQYTNAGAIRNSWMGGTQTGLADVASAVLIVEQPFQVVTGAYLAEATTTSPVVTAFPVAVREHWQSIFYKYDPTQTNLCKVQIGTQDLKSAPFAGVVPCAFADGHAKAVPVGQFLANTPSAADFGLPASTSFCKTTAAYYGTTTPTWSQSWPFWGLQ